MSANQQEPFLTIGATTIIHKSSAGDDIGEGNIEQVPIFFKEDWGTGLGGGLWSTGLAFAKYLATPHAKSSLEGIFAAKKQRWKQQKLPSTEDSDGLSVLELGSGNGILSICLLALGRSIISDLSTTDLASHLPLIETTMGANRHIVDDARSNLHVFEHVWGEFLNSSLDDPLQETSFQKRVQQGEHKFDVIVGSDVAYHADLYDALIQSLLRYSNENTIILLGITMADTKPSFFHKLRHAGFDYNKFSDNLLSEEFRGTTFGIFVVRRHY